MSSLDGKTICFTGTLVTQTRAQASATAMENGAAKVSSSITKATDLLVVGPTGAGSKLKQAESKGIEVWTEEEFNKVVGVTEVVKKKPAAPAKKPAAKKKRTKKAKVEEEPAEDEESPAEESNSIKGKTVCFTGTLVTQTRAEASATALENGAAKVSASITKATNLLVVGPTGAGAKLEQAKSKGIEVWTEEKFNEVVGVKGDEEAAEDDSEAAEDEADSHSPMDVSDSLEGKTVCFTGTLVTQTRAQASKLAVEHGAAKVSGTVTKATDLLVVGPTGAGSKLEQAKAKGIEVWTEEKFNLIVGVTEVIKTPQKKKRSSDDANETSPSAKKKLKMEDGVSSAISGKVICFTGALVTQTRDQASAIAVKFGATTASSVSNKVDLLVMGPTGAGSKLQAAERKGIEVWTEEQFNEVVGVKDVIRSPRKTTPMKSPSKSTPAKKSKSGDLSTSLEGKTVCFTGALVTQTRTQASKVAMENGAAKVSSSITKATNLLVVGPTGAGVKLAKAEEEGIEVWTEEKFNKVVGISK